MIDVKKILTDRLSEIIADGADTMKLRDFFKPSSLEELPIKCILWGKYHMPKYFGKPTPEFHYDLVHKFFRKGNDYTACPRGFGKSSIAQLCIAYSCANGLDEFIVLIEKTWNEAAEVLEAVREEFKLNDQILRTYEGDLTKINSKGNDQENIKDSSGDFFINGVRLRAKGFDSPIRGLKSRHSRPTTVVLDDIESDEHIDNIVQREKYLNNYIKGVIPAVDNEIGKIKMLGTILHDDSLLNTLIKEHNGKVYAAWDENRKLLWASNWTVEKLEQKRMEMRISEKGDASFYQEYFNQPLNEDDQKFKRNMFQYFKNLDLEKIKEKPHRIYTLVDPAISKKTTADYTAIISVLVDYMNRIFVLEITRERLNPIETIKHIFSHYERHKPIYVGIETTAYQKALKFFIDEQKLKENSTVRTMTIKEINPTSDKVTKIMKLQPKYAILNVFHNSDDKNTKILEEELLRFPKAVHDDVCLTSNTLVATIKGQLTINNIQVGDMVLTRQGYKRVLWAGKTGTKKVITRFGLSGTPNHLVWTENRGWTELQLLKTSDKLVYLDRQLFGTEKNITDTQNQSTGNYENIFHAILKIKNHLGNCIGIFGNILMEKFLMVCIFITKMALTTINYLLLKWSLHLNMEEKNGNLLSFLLEKKDGLSRKLFLLRLSREITKKEKKKEDLRKRRSSESILIRLMQLFVAKIVGLQSKMHHGENIMSAQNAKKNEDTQLDTYQERKATIENANIVEKISIQKVKVSDIALKTANIKECCTDSGSVVDVYNLEVEDCHEYFANGILVHNCDCLSNIIEIIVPIAKVTKNNYKKYLDAKKTGSRVCY